MNSQSVKAVAEVTSLAPQFLVDDLSVSIAYYRDRLGKDFYVEDLDGYILCFSEQTA